MHNTVGGEYNSGGVVLADKQLARLQQDANGNLLTAPGSAASSTPQIVVTQPNEAVTVISTTSAQVISSGWSIAGAVPLSGGFVSGASFASLRHLSVDVIGSQSANITATILRGATVSSVVAAGSAVSFHMADAKQVIGQEVLTPTPLPGAAASGGGTVYRATGLDYVVPNGGQVVIQPSASMTLPGTATSSGVTVGAGVA